MRWAWFVELYTVIIINDLIPGSARIVLLASGLKYGIQRTWPLFWGISVGLILMNFSVALGLGAVLGHHPILLKGLTWLGIAFLLYLAWRIHGTLQFSELI